MARAYSEDLRRRVVGAVEAGASCRQAAVRFGVSVSFVVKLLQRWRGSGTLAARRVGGRRAHRLAEHAELVKRLVAAEPDLTLEELRRRLGDEGVVIGRSSIDRYLTVLGLTRKKRRAMPPNRLGRTWPAPGPRGRPTSRT
jgi:transposase